MPNIIKYYYILLLIILCCWTYDYAPNMILRLSYLCALVFPLFFLNETYKYAPYVVLTFTAVSAYGFASSFLPTETYYYTIILAIIAIMVSTTQKIHCRVPTILILYTIYIAIVDLIFNSKLENISYSSFAIIFALSCIDITDGTFKKSFSQSFAIITIILCFYFFIFGNRFIETGEDLERVLWKDPNYLGAVAGVGVVASYIQIITNNRSKFYLVAFILGFVMLALNASRGAALSTISAIIIYTLFSNIKFGIKFGVIFFGCIFFIFLYEFHIFDLLLTRIQEDDGTGNARTIIWAYKFDGYSAGTFFQKLFGIGYKNGFMLGTQDGYGFHNDYLAHLVDYGIVGIVLFIILLLYPILVCWPNKFYRATVVAYISYLAICCFTIEPMTAGRITYFFLYLFALTLSIYARYQYNLTTVTFKLTHTEQVRIFIR